MENPTFSFVIPVYNEEPALPELYKRMVTVLDQLGSLAEVILIDDGSRDNSFALMLGITQKDPRFKAIQFARNFGHQIAITAGMDAALGDATIVMDADLQDPPEVVLQMIEKWREGFEIVYAVRSDREGETLFKKLTATLFYRALKAVTDVDIPLDVGDFRLVDRKALEAFKSLRENNRFVRGMFSWIGFRQTGVKFQRAERYAGTTKYPFRKMWKLAMDGVISFSTAPLRLALNIGFLVSVLSFLLGFAAILSKIAGWYTVPGWASVMVVTSFLGGVQLIVLGFLGEYIGRIHDEVKDRPLYIVRRAVGMPSAPGVVMGREKRF
jgi:glycosyltransferase involved in cell wall biosynthesis